jgi:hypothetical protein
MEALAFIFAFFCVFVVIFLIGLGFAIAKFGAIVILFGLAVIGIIVVLSAIL